MVKFTLLLVLLFAQFACTKTDSNNQDRSNGKRPASSPANRKP